MLFQLLYRILYIRSALPIYLGALLCGGCMSSTEDGSLFRSRAAGDLPTRGKTYGASILNINSDDIPDLLLSTHSNTPSLFIGLGDGTFERYVVSDMPNGILDQHGSAACDYNNDGKCDIYITVGAHRGHGWSLNQLWQRTETGHFVNVAVDAPILADPVGRGRGGVWVDFNRDNSPELLLLNYRSPVRLLSYRNKSWQDFTSSLPVVPDFPYWARSTVIPSPKIRAASAWSHSASVTDLNNDGWGDLVLIGHLGMSGLWLNNGGGSLVDRTSSLGFKNAIWPHAPEHAAAGDLDEDGDMDLVLVYRPDKNVRPRRHPLEIRLNENNKGYSFAVGLPISAVDSDTDPAACLLADLDNDGHLDIYLVAKRSEGPTPPNIILQGNGDGTFDDVGNDWGGLGTNEGDPESALLVDVDIDGDLDLLAFNGGDDSDELSGGIICYENCSSLQKGITLELVDPAGTPHGLGARVVCGGQVREVRSVATPFSSSVLPVHFGLGTDAGPVKLSVYWPTPSESYQRQDVTLSHTGAAYRLVRGENDATRLVFGE